MIIQLQKLILIFLRITSFIVVCPGFSYKGFPNILKVSLSFVFTVLVYSITPEIEIGNELLYFLLLSFKEVLLGVAIGFISKVIFAAAEIAGQLIDFQVGFSMASVYNPLSGTSASNYGKVYYWLSISLFFVLDLHHAVIETLVKSFQYVPLGTVVLNEFNPEGIVKLFGIAFELGLNLSVPMIIVVLVTDIALGIISKTVPQINVLMLGMPLKAIISFIAFMMILSWVMREISGIVGSVPGYIENFLQSQRW